MSERDARIDPRRGDVLRKGRQMRFVKDRYPANVTYETATNRKEKVGGYTFMDLDYFRKWAKNAEVVERAE